MSQINQIGDIFATGKAKPKKQLLLYRKQTRKRLLGRFNSYASLLKWVGSSGIKQEEHVYIFVRSTKNIR